MERYTILHNNHIKLPISWQTLGGLSPTKQKGYNDLTEKTRKKQYNFQENIGKLGASPDVAMTDSWEDTDKASTDAEQSLTGECMNSEHSNSMLSRDREPKTPLPLNTTEGTTV